MSFEIVAVSLAVLLGSLASCILRADSTLGSPDRGIARSLLCLGAATLGCVATLAFSAPAAAQGTGVDECALGLHDCDVNATCTDTEEAWTCACNVGFAGSGTSGDCIDVDECAFGLDDCDVNAACTNTLGGFSCACNAGFAGDGLTCTDVDECDLGLDNCDANATCTNTLGDFTCACNVGFAGDGLTCSPVGPPTVPGLGRFALMVLAAGLSGLGAWRLRRGTIAA